MRISMNRILLGALLIAGALAAKPAVKEDPRGHWIGNINQPGHVVAVAIDLDQAPEGWFGSMAIPAKKASGLPLEAIGFTNGKWTFRIKGLPGEPTFTGTLSSHGSTLSGDFTQGGESFPLR